MKRKRIAILLLLILSSIFTGCTYTYPNYYNILTEKVYHKSFDSIWDRLIDMVDLYNINVKSIDKESGILYGEIPLNFNPYIYMDCGGPGTYEIINSYQSNFNIIIMAKTDQTTKVIIKTHYEAVLNYNYEDTNRSNRIRCNSKGKLEKEIFLFLDKN